MKDQPNKTEKGHKRPGKLMLLCILGFAIAALIIPAIINNPFHELAWFSLYLVLVLVVSVLSLVGIWMMKKWGFIVYALLFGVNQAILAYYLGGWLYLIMVLPVVVLIFSYHYYPELE